MKKIIVVLSIIFALVVISQTTMAATSTQNTAIQLTTTLENSKTTPQWNYASNINDGRGITFGVVGFCTGTYDGNKLIKYYTSLNSNNVLAKYIPALDKIDAGSHNGANGDGNPSTIGLDGFISDVQNCNDPLFKQAQIYEINQLYWNPAVNIYNSIGAHNTLTLAFIYDMSVRHGPDGAQSIVSDTTSQLGGTPASGIDENTFLSRMISLRDDALKAEGLGDTNRDVGFKALLDSGNINLITPFQFIAYDDSFTIDGNVDLETNTNNIDNNNVTNDTTGLVGDFYGNVTSGSAPLTVTFIVSTYSNGKQTPVTHTFTAKGTYTVVMTLTDGINTRKLTKTDYITVT